jgi:hypothetical protein
MTLGVETSKCCPYVHYALSDRKPLHASGASSHEAVKERRKAPETAPVVDAIRREDGGKTGSAVLMLSNPTSLTQI